MKLHKKQLTSYKKKVEAVEYYIQTGKSLREVGYYFNVPYKTLWFWVNLYKAEGKERLKCRKTCRKKESNDFEIKVILLKENNPTLSIDKARQIMKGKGFDISNKRVWEIWKKYGYSYRKEIIKDDPLCIFIDSTPELEYEINKAKKLVAKGELKCAAEILNKYHRLPECDLLTKIPKKFLSLQRKFELLNIQYGKVPHKQYLIETRNIRKNLEKRGFIYSSIIACFLELKLLNWFKKLKKRIDLLNHLSEKMDGINDKSFKFHFYLHQVLTYGSNLQLDKTLYALRKCHKLLYQLPYPFYWERFADILTYVGRYQKAYYYYKIAYESIEEKIFYNYLILKIIFCGYCIAGKYSGLKNLLIKIQSIENSINYAPMYYIVKAQVSFGTGKLNDASKYFIKSLERARKDMEINYIYGASLGLAEVAFALNRKEKGIIYLKKYLPLIKKHKLTFEVLVLKCLINKDEIIPDEFTKQHHPLCLLKLILKANKTLKPSDYRKALNYSNKRGLSGLYHRWIIFFPELIINILKNGGDTGLPKVILNYPIFNQKTLSYHIKFLGKLQIYREAKILRKYNLSPKESAFLIYLSLKKNRKIYLKNLYQNFWAKSMNPLNNLSHLLVQIKKKISLPSHFIKIRGEYLIWDFYLTTDYATFNEILIYAKALEKAGEWRYANMEYLRAFKIFRGQPFYKMYDNWSDEKHIEIMFNYEDELKSFSEKLKSRGRVEEAKSLLKKASKIISG